MYVHAYQSYVWNAIVSERIKTWGADRPIPGDLVLEPGTAARTDVDVEDGEDSETATMQSGADVGPWSPRTASLSYPCPSPYLRRASQGAQKQQKTVATTTCENSHWRGR
jgi:tRNA(Glu) U13 pseudouridine synthase TruD